MGRFPWCVVACLLLVACGGDDGGGPATSATAITSSPTSTAPESTTTVTTAAASTTSPETTTEPGDAVSEISAAFVTFFDGLQSVDAKVDVLEHGEELRSMLEDAAQNEQFQQLSTIVTSVARRDDAACGDAGVPAPCAEVIHDLLVGDFPMMVAHVGWATEVDGRWKVAAATWCDIVKVGGATCPSFG
jgi:hypothetical protein